MTQFELIKKLEYLVAFQTNCLRDGDWKTFDKTENEIKKLEENILRNKEISETQQGFTVNTINST